MKYKRLSIEGPEPVTLPEAKRQCFATDSSDDELIERLIRTARAYAEKEIWRAIVPATYVAFDDVFSGEIEVPSPPLISVEKIEYLGSDGEMVLIDPDKYRVDELSEPGRIQPVGKWPQTPSGMYNAVQIIFKAGYEDNVPENITHAILMMVKHFFDNPEAVVVSGGGISVNEVPMGVQDLLNQESVRVTA